MTLSTVAGVLGSLVLAVSSVVPSPFGVPVGLVGFLLSSLAGLAAQPPSVTASRPVLQGAALALATGAFGLLSQVYHQIPVGLWQNVALFVVGLLAWLTGSALPALGSTAPAQAEAPGPAPVTREKAIELILKGPRP